MFFWNREERFKLAENTQGMYFSQQMFNIMKWQDPNFSDAYFEQSVAFNKRGEFEKGFELLDKAVDIDPKLHLGYRGWMKYEFLRDYNGSINDLKRLDSLTPNFVDAPWGRNIHYLLGLSYKGLKQYDLALNEFNQSIKSEDSSFVDINLFLHKGVIYYYKKNYQKAMQNFEAYIKFNYNNITPESCYWKGITFKKLGEIDSSKILLEKSKELYSKGLKNKDFYNEVQDELYLSDIEKALNTFEK